MTPAEQRRAEALYWRAMVPLETYWVDGAGRMMRKRADRPFAEHHDRSLWQPDIPTPTATPPACAGASRAAAP